ncbi:hypothetical protein [Candidatus Clostridium stratigraminis]|uniref:Uncharacterized protein n=1 Tax=Candidatus Clostridium stratigraminis TaxID=3381661 RepID=A0ABW8T905_9CLOT
MNIDISSITSSIMPKKRRKAQNIKAGVGALGVLAGAGIAYMAIKQLR